MRPTLGEITIIIFRCFSMEELRYMEDFVLTYREEYNNAEMTCLYQMLTVRNKMLIDEGIERKRNYEF